MEVKEALKNLREKVGLSQQELADKLFVTRQAVSRWENGETTPNIETLKTISKEFDVSINTLLGSPQNLTCQCCGMPLSDYEQISIEKDGSLNETYCKWCYTDGEFVYKSLDELMNFLIPHLSNIHKVDKAKMQSLLSKQLPELSHWKK